MVENVLHKAAEMAQIILQLNDYERISLPTKILDHYFLDGDEYSLLEIIRQASVEVTPEINLPDDAPS